MKSSNESAGKTEAASAVLELEFPDWNGMVSRERPLTFEQALRHSEELRAMFPAKPGEAERRRAWKCAVEFIL